MTAGQDGSGSGDMGRCRLWLAVLVCLAPVVARAQDGTDAFRRAEREFTAGRYAEAEPLYRRAAASGYDALRITCYQRLMQIYGRLGRLDLAIQSGLRCRELLQHGGAPDGLREVDLQVGECYLVLGHHRTADRYLKRALDPAAPGEPLSALGRLTAMQLMARSAERSGDRERASRLWAGVENAALEQLDARRTALTLPQRIELVWNLSDSYRYHGRSGPAIELLLPLLAVHDRLGDRPAKRDTLRRLAGHYALRHQPERAEEYLRQALALNDDSGAAGRRLQGELTEELAEQVALQGRKEEAGRLRRQAAEAYAGALAAAGKGRSASAEAVIAFWHLQKLYQKMSQYPQALLLAETQAGHWAGSTMLDPRLVSELGFLRGLRGASAGARDALRGAVAELESQSPANLLDLPRALTNLAAVEEATGDVQRAEELAKRCLELYHRHSLPQDLVVVEAHNVLGDCCVESGRNAAAVEQFRAGADLCERLGREADAPRCNLLLNLALLYKSQAEFAPATRVCAEARNTYRRLPGWDPLGLGAFDAAMAGLYATQGKLDDAYSLVPALQQTCARYALTGGPIKVAALNCQGLYLLARRDFAGAVAAWEELRRIQEKEKQALLLPRTLNYLGLAAELQGRLADAEAFYGRARDLQRGNPRAFPVTQFITLWRLAGLARRRGQRAEARGLLEQAVGMIEAARLQIFGAGEQRSGYYSQFAPGFEQLVDLCLADGDVEGAVVALTRSRGRALVDQLLLAGVDPCEELRGEDGKQLRAEEEALRRRISALRARAQTLPLEAADEDSARKLLASLDEAQQLYAGLWRKILNASPLYHNLTADLSAGPFLKALRGRALPADTLLLLYHLGPQRSHLLLVDKSAGRAEAFALTVPAAVAERAAGSPTPSALEPVWGLRGLRLRPLTAPAGEPVAGSAGPGAPLTAALARVLVDECGRQLADPGFRPTRGLRLKPRDPGQPLPTQPSELLVEAFLPAAVRRRIRDSGARRIVVVPDGALHRLPLEALVVQAGAQPRYVVDELPPIAYAPSAAVLTVLADRPRPRGPMSLLTVCNPAYPAEPAAIPAKAATARGVLGFRGQLPALPATAVESRRIRALFNPAQVTALEGTAATEGAVKAAVGSKRFVHLAAHAFADEHFGNLFGAVALTPPAGSASDEEDGWLSLHEIYRLPLRDCELAVLSACVTNVGPQEPLEAGITLAAGFLAAGARRVVASHWSVDDEATAALMTSFFKEITASAGRGESVDYAAAMQKARLAVRSRPGCAAPFFWAPFVLLGAVE
jgi:CHAT domain-containing protein